MNKINLSENCKVFGSLEFGGLSNYWELQIDPNILNDIKIILKNQKRDITIIHRTSKRINLAGKYQNYKNSFKGDNFFSITNKDKSSLQFEDFIIEYKNVLNKKKIDDVNEISDKLVPKNYYDKFLKKKKIKFKNYFVKKIKKHGKIIEVLCSDGNVNKSFYAKKLVIGSGTVVTTKLILDYLMIKKEIKLKHHPRLFSLYLSSKKWSNKMSFQPSQVHLKLKNELFTADFRPGNKLIMNSIIQFKVSSNF